MKTQTKIYVSTYAKYNEGNLNGEWITIQDYSDAEELMQEMKDLHEDEDDPEFMIQDSEGDLTALIGECMSIEDWNEFYEVLDAVEDSYLDIEAIEAYANNFCGEWSAKVVEDASDAYIGEYDNDEDFAQEYAESTGAINQNKNWPHYCIDWKWAARELMYDIFESNGYYFYNH